MPSSKENGIAVATEQLGSMSLGESVEGEDNETDNNEDTEENGTPTILCSACEKECDTLKKCTACKCVWYCDKDCQKRHRKEHKKECKRIKKELDKRGGKLDAGKEKDIGPLGKLPPKEECPICMRVFPIHPSLQRYYACCGKSVCGSCDLQRCIKRYKHCVESGEWAEEEQIPLLCYFCRTALPKSDEEILARARKRVELKDPKALSSMAGNYGFGLLGLPVDQTKCIDLLHEAASLGSREAQHQLGQYYCNGEKGLETNQETGLKYLKEAAEGGHLLASNKLGCAEAENGDLVATMRHWRLSASGGLKMSMNNIIICFEEGQLHHGDLAATLQAFYLARAEMRSKDRDVYIAYLKMTGEYEEEFDCY